MILTELYRLYDRLAKDKETAEMLPAFGKSKQKMSFEVLLSPDGKLLDIQDAREPVVIPAKGKAGKEKTKIVPGELIVLGGAHPPGSAATPRLLWDTTAYVFGVYPEKAKKTDKDRKKAREILFPAFRDRQRKFMEDHDIHDPGLKAVVTFLDSWDPGNIAPQWLEKINEYGDNFGLFRIAGQSGYVCESPEILKAWDAETSNPSNAGAIRGQCLISGEENVPIVATVDTKIKLPGTSAGGGSIASFNAPADESYGKEQTYNSPLSEAAAFKAYNALNYLIADPVHHFKLAETTVVFWTEEKTTTESLFPFIFNGTPSTETVAQDTVLLERLKAFGKAVSSAGDPDLSAIGDDVKTHFFMLGIEPNAARIVIRFWHESTLGDFVLKLRAHHNDMRIQKAFEDDPFPIPVWQILAQTARETKNIPPLLGGELLRAVIDGGLYPKSLYQLTLNRVNVAHDKYKVGAKVSYLQASVIKGFLSRSSRLTRDTNKGELTMSLNVENKNPAYLLGRLFATLEKTQNDASGGVNAGIGDKFYSSASATPRTVFPTLLDLFRKHIKKLSGDNKPLAIGREKAVGEILDSIDSTEGFPPTLSLEERGFFALGYYQQMRFFYTKKKTGDEAPVEKSDVR